MPIRSGAMQRPRGCRYDDVGLPCRSTIGSPFPTSTYAISLPRTRRRCFLYGNAAEIMLGSPSLFVVHRLEGKWDARRGPASPSVCGSDKGLWLWRMAWSGGRSARALTDERCDQCPTVT